MLRALRFVLAVVILMAPLETLATVEIVLTNGDRIAGRAVEQRDGLFLLDLPAGRTVTVPTQLVDSILFDEGDVTAPTDDRPPRIQVVLVDGRVLTARSVRRRADLFLVSIGADETIPLPLGLVRRIRFVERNPAPSSGASEPDRRYRIPGNAP
jgi:hypothetical protein